MKTLKIRAMAGVASVALISAVFGPTVAEAGTATSNFTVSTTVNSPCTFTTANLAFPNYNSGSISTVNGTANFTIACSGVSLANPDPVNITFTTASGTFAMTNGANTL